MKFKVLMALMVLVALPLVTYGATRDVPLKWTQESVSVYGDPIVIQGFRVYDEAGVFLKLFDGTARQGTMRVNIPFGRNCFKMKSFYLQGTTEIESDFSNVAGCIDVVPGKPVPPVVLQ